MRGGEEFFMCGGKTTDLHNTEDVNIPQQRMTSTNQPCLATIWALSQIREEKKADPARWDNDFYHASVLPHTPASGGKVPPREALSGIHK